MITLRLTEEEAEVIRTLAAKLGTKRRPAGKHSVLAFFDAHPAVPDRQLALMARERGLYSPSTYLGDIVLTIQNHRKV